MTFAVDHVVCGGGNCTAQGPCYYEEISPTLKAGGVHGVAYTVDMGGGYTPMIVEPITYDAQVTNPLHKDNAEGGVCHTLNSDSRNYVVIPLQDDGTTSVNKRGPGWNEGGSLIH